MRNVNWAEIALLERRWFLMTQERLNDMLDVKKVRRWWWHWSEDIGAFLWLVVAFMICGGLWLVFDGLERFWR